MSTEFLRKYIDVINENANVDPQTIKRIADEISNAVSGMGMGAVTSEAAEFNELASDFSVLHLPEDYDADPAIIYKQAEQAVAKISKSKLPDETKAELVDKLEVVQMYCGDAINFNLISKLLDSGNYQEAKKEIRMQDTNVRDDMWEVISQNLSEEDFALAQDIFG